MDHPTTRTTAIYTSYVFITLLYTSGIHSYPDSPDKDCILDHDGTNPILEQCLNKGHQFVKNYLKALKKTTQRSFNTCGEFAGFGQCMRSLWQKCSTVRQVTDRHWTPIVDLFTSACNLTDLKFAFHHEVQCLETEMTGALVHRCDELYDVNLQQKTRDKCVFLKEAIHCKTALVTTACGDQVGEVAYSLAKINAKKLVEKARCYITLDEPYTGFRYNEWCPRDFKDDMLDCYEEHILPTQLSFIEDNDLIASKTKKEIRQACGGLRKYRACIKPMRQECKDGVEKLYEQNGTLRIYLLKMDYICRGEEKEVYTEKLGCLQEVVKNKSLGVCNHLWSELKPWLGKVTSYAFYCEAHNRDTMAMQQVLENLRYCYERIFSIKCEATTGSVMSELIRRAFADPLYLRYGYKVDCSFHTATRKRSKPHYRVSSHYRHPGLTGNEEGVGGEGAGNVHRNSEHQYGEDRSQVTLQRGEGGDSPNSSNSALHRGQSYDYLVFLVTLLLVFHYSVNIDNIRLVNR